MDRQQLLLSGIGLAGAVSALVAEPAWAKNAQVTGVRLNPTPSGLEVILDTENGQLLQAFTASYGETFVADIISAQLRLPQGSVFRQDSPAPGIASVTVAQLDTNSIRVKVTGNTGVPAAQVIQGGGGLILSFKAAPSTAATQPVQPPAPIALPPAGQPSVEPPAPVRLPPAGQPSVEPPAPVRLPPAGQPSVEPPAPVRLPPAGQPSVEPPAPVPLPPAGQPGTAPATPAPPASGPSTRPPAPVALPPAGEQVIEAPVEVIVTATRVEEPVTNVARSVTVIDTEQVQQQTGPSRNLGETLGNTVPGFAPPTQNIGSFGQTLRGRGVSVLIDGVPQTTNIQSFGRELRTIDPGAVERIEVVRGATAAYGGQATGGVINIITRRAAGERLTAKAEVGLNTSLTNSEDNFGYNLLHQISGREGQFDFTGSFSLASSGAFYDAQGDRIPLFEVGGDSSRTLNMVAKIGVDLDDRQRLQLSFNHFQDNQYPNIIPDFSVDEEPGRQKARGIEVGRLNIIGAQGPENRNDIINLSYTNQNLLGSDVQVQAYYRNTANSGVPSDYRTSSFFEVIGVANSRAKTEQLGGRLQIKTPLSTDRNVSLLWGADAVREDSLQRFELFDTEDFDASGGRVYRKIGERPFVPPYQYSSLGLYGQLEWDIEDRVILTGGARHERLGLSVDDYTMFNDRQIGGGDRNFNATLFNAGIVYKATSIFSVFANFSQGFAAPDFARILRQPSDDFTSVDESLTELQPQKVNNYEIGLRSQWEKVQTTFSAFYNTSDLGTTFQPVGNSGRFELLRAPERIYGLEATVDWQPEETWELGGTASYVEGEFDDDDDGDYLALDSSRISPVKLTAYIENETLPGWRNRLQLLYSGNRDRGFKDGNDGGPISSYVAVDYISSINIGPGILQLRVENLLNNQYFPVLSQYLASFEVDSSNYAARGRSLSLNYQLTW